MSTATLPRETIHLSRPHRASGVWVNDVHSALNATRVQSVLTPGSEAELGAVIRRAAERGEVVCASGSRHAMGGQQFAAGAALIDTRSMHRVLSLDGERGLVEAEAGIEWPALIDGCLAAQPGAARPWTIAQKQTGADNFTLGGSLSANIHGRGLAMKPLVGDIESFTLVDADGESVRCSRSENADLFRLAIGGYGLFGVISRVTLRLTPRRKVQRWVTMTHSDEVIAQLHERIGEGCRYGDFQFSIDERSPDFLQAGVLSCYRPVDDRTALSAPRELSSDDWLTLLRLAYTDRAEGFRRYAAHYRATDGQVYSYDTHQLSPYVADYAAKMRASTAQPASLVITELYVPREHLADFLGDSACLLRASGVPLIYGTVRLIERDDETFLAWARQPYACVIFNLLTSHDPASRARSAGVFRDLIDLAIARGGSFYLTYHRHGPRRQVEACYPQFREFLAQKERRDPDGRFQSDWYRHYRDGG